MRYERDENLLSYFSELNTCSDEWGIMKQLTGMNEIHFHFLTQNRLSFPS